MLNQKTLDIMMRDDLWENVCEDAGLTDEELRAVATKMSPADFLYEYCRGGRYQRYTITELGE